VLPCERHSHRGLTLNECADREMNSYQTLQFFAGAIGAPALQLNAAAKPG
jgi:hypothetical protein